MVFFWVCMPYGNVHPDVSEERIASTFSVTKSGSGGCCCVWVEMHERAIWEVGDHLGNQNLGKGRKMVLVFIQWKCVLKSLGRFPATCPYN